MLDGFVEFCYRTETKQLTLVWTVVTSCLLTSARASSGECVRALSVRVCVEVQCRHVKVSLMELWYTVTFQELFIAWSSDEDSTRTEHWTLIGH